ncbi:MAG: hypothetical protein HYV15_03775, partial [Elusimicrobia bacterium]|nr:hypothetical protein [Elusimicrobiota bacterium]
GLDEFLGDNFFSAGVPPTSNVVFWSTQTVTASTASYFVGLGIFGVPAGKSAGVVVDSASAFTFVNGSLAAGQALPAASALAVSQFSLAASPFDMGYPVPQAGASASGGFWNTGALGVSGAGGLGSTGGLGGALPIGALVARIGGSSWFLVGSSKTFVSTQSGPLALAMNDTDYNDNSSQLAVDFHIVPSTVTQTWVGGSAFGAGADIPNNWASGQLPQPGESIVFSGANDCDWNLFQLNVGAWTMSPGYTGTVRLRGTNSPDDFNALQISSHAVIAGGTLDMGRNKEFRVQGGLFVTNGASFDLGRDNGRLFVGPAGVVVSGGGRFRYAPDANAYSQVIPAGFNTVPFVVANGTVNITGAGFLRMERANATLSAAADIQGFHGVGFDEWETNTTAALTLVRSTTPVLTLRDLHFFGNYTTNVNASGVGAGAVITIQDSLGPNRGTPKENDPNNVLFWNPDGGGSANISGSIIDNVAAGPAASFTRIRASTQPFFDTFGPQGGLEFNASIGGQSGAYSLNNLDAPATYYLFAWHDANNDFFPNGVESRGGFGTEKKGLLRSDPVYVVPTDNLTGKDITVRDWGQVNVDLQNGSQQFGPMMVGAVSLLADGVSTNAVEALSYSQGPGFFNLSVPATSLVLIGWVDVNNNREFDDFEASGSSAVITLPQSQTYPGTVSITAGGGTA